MIASFPEVRKEMPILVCSAVVIEPLSQDRSAPKEEPQQNCCVEDQGCFLGGARHREDRVVHASLEAGRIGREHGLGGAGHKRDDPPEDQRKGPPPEPHAKEGEEAGIPEVRTTKLDCLRHEGDLMESVFVI